MKRMKLMILVASVGILAGFWGQCATFWGDVVGDAIVLGAVD